MLQARVAGVAFAGLLAFTTTATADPFQPAEQARPVPTGQAASASASSSAFEGAQALDASLLEGLSGGQSLNVSVNSRQVLTATNSGNRVDGQTVGSGAISLNENAFSGFSGVGNFVMNTGHNNNLQGSLNVTVITTPAPPPGS